jgi:hypothetical protein
MGPCASDLATGIDRAIGRTDREQTEHTRPAWLNVVRVTLGACQLLDTYPSTKLLV